MSDANAAAAVAANPAQTAAAVPAGAPTIWHEGKVDPTIVGFWQNKGIDPADPVAVATKLTEFYRNAEGKIGAPPEEMIRIPKPNAAEADIKAYWQRIGVPAEAKEYDLSTVKMGGKELETAFSEVIRGALHAGRVPKDRAAEIAAPLIKHLEAQETARLAERTAIVKEQQEALDKNWGTNKAYNLAIAERTLQDHGKAAGLTPEQTKQAWDALTTVGGIGASYALEMLRSMGQRMGEAPFVTPQPGNNSNSGVMSVDQAIAEIESLKSDKAFYKSMVLDKSVEAKRRWDNLHKIAGPELQRRRSA
jgi:hypothetical protein